MAHGFLSPWTADRIDRVKQLALDGWTATDIANDLACEISRNAVIGKIHRNGFTWNCKANQRPIRERQPRLPRPDAPPRLRSSAARIASKMHKPEIDEDVTDGIIDMPPEAITDTAVTLFDAKPGQCRYPLGEPSSSDFRFCGDKQKIGYSWCHRHFRLVYQTTASRQKEKAEWLAQQKARAAA